MMKEKWAGKPKRPVEVVFNDWRLSNEAGEIQRDSQAQSGFGGDTRR